MVSYCSYFCIFVTRIEAQHVAIQLEWSGKALSGILRKADFLSLSAND